MKLSNEAKKIVEGNKKKIKYDMKNINGGFSDGVEIQPGEHSGIMNISVNIYGGNTKSAHPYQVPPSIKKLQAAYIAATQVGDPVSGNLKVQLEAYYTNLRRAISLEMVKLIQQFDAGASESISTAVQTINQKYQ